MGSPCWSRLLPGPADPWREEPVLEQVCWQDRFWWASAIYPGQTKTITKLLAPCFALKAASTDTVTKFLLRNTLIVLQFLLRTK